MAAEIDIDQRFLCADGACIGVVGADGRCKVCSMPLSPRDVAEFERLTGAQLGPEFERVDPAQASELAPDADGAAAWTATPDEAPDLDGRVLCADGNCIGVIGPDGSCKVCGKPSTAEAEVAE